MMTISYYPLFVLLAPLAYVFYGAYLSLQQKSITRKQQTFGSKIGIFGIGVAVIASIIIYQTKSSASPLLGYGGFGFSLRLDALSLLMFTMIALLGFVIIKFSQNYLDGDIRQKVFLSRLSFTIASVLLLVVSGNLGQLFFVWVSISLLLHQLLVFYRGRSGAIVAARKKFIAARAGDILFAIAVFFIYKAYGTGDLDVIFTNAKSVFASEKGWYLEVATVCLALVALLKSAQFPTHGWLIEVVETPTPVSALLHAGILNAGPFLVVRMAFLFNESTVAPIILIIMGGFTALFASVVFLTQPSVKVALGYSSVAHMGFMLLICGFGVYTAAMLHLVAHSFYKAHAFLSSGSVVDVVRANKIKLPARLGSIFRILGSLIVALSIYFFMSWVWDIDPIHEFTLLATGAIIVMGLTQILVPVFDTQAKFKGLLKACGMALVVSTSFFTLESIFDFLLLNQIPQIVKPSATIVILTSCVIVIFGIAVWLQLMPPSKHKSNITYKWGVHFRNGFYANAIFDRLVGSLKKESFATVHLEIKEHDISEEYVVTLENANKHPVLQTALVK